MKNKYWKKMIAPIVITGVLLMYFLAFLIFGFFAQASGIFRIIAFVVPLSMMGACIYVLWERIQEIKSGEEDDLNQY